MHYVGSRNPRAEANPARSIPLYQAPGRVFGPSPESRAIGDLRQAMNATPGWATRYAAACARLGWANRTRRECRRANQAHAMCELNRVRQAMRANARAVAAAEAALVALGLSPEAIAAARPAYDAKPNLNPIRKSPAFSPAAAAGQTPTLAAIRQLLASVQVCLADAEAHEGGEAERDVQSAAWRLADAGLLLRRACEFEDVGGAGITTPTGRGAALPGA